jgi:hypothetical protein
MSDEENGQGWDTPPPPSEKVKPMSKELLFNVLNVDLDDEPNTQELFETYLKNNPQAVSVISREKSIVPETPQPEDSPYSIFSNFYFPSDYSYDVLPIEKLTESPYKNSSNSPDILRSSDDLYSDEEPLPELASELRRKNQQWKEQQQKNQQNPQKKINGPDPNNWISVRRYKEEPKNKKPKRR